MLTAGRESRRRVVGAGDDDEVAADLGAARNRRAAADDHQVAVDDRRAPQLRFAEHDDHVLIDVPVDRRVAEDDDRLADFGAGLEDELLTEPEHRTAPRVLIDPYLDLRGGADRQRDGGHGQQRGKRESHSRHECTALPKATWLSAVPNATHARNITATTANA